MNFNIFSIFDQSCAAKGHFMIEQSAWINDQHWIYKVCVQCGMVEAPDEIYNAVLHIEDEWHRNEYARKKIASK
jgi:hypothetical protein